MVVCDEVKERLEMPHSQFKNAFIRNLFLACHVERQRHLRSEVIFDFERRAALANNLPRVSAKSLLTLACRIHGELRMSTKVLP
ncbi:hypothetical protein [Bradyrhizobium sp. RT3b]|uniref:hypothetical protein n=1 Tax=Bradyrhizobium sp. RT3b TaxID=3156334 RepID=UPI0033918428